MADNDFPKPVGEIVSTLADIFRHQRNVELVEMFEKANAWLENIGYDNWNGGSYTWALRLEIPVAIFASAEPRLTEIESQIKEKLGYFSRMYTNQFLTEITIAPSTSKSLRSQRTAAPEAEVQRLWPLGRFRLFLSHVAVHKVAVSKLKDELETRGVSAFVAHEAIKPSLEWQKEIELALHSMQALAALITKDFHASSWTDQEIGWAFGRGVLVVPVRLGVDPYGFAGKVQGISADLKNPVGLADALVNSLLTNPQTHGEMRAAIVNALTASSSYMMSIKLSDFIAGISDFTDEQKKQLWKACEENDQVMPAYKVTDVIYKTIGSPPKKKKKAVTDETPF